MYRKGDKVWILDSNQLKLGNIPGTDVYYKINEGEIDIRGKEVIITCAVNKTNGDGVTKYEYSCEEYRYFFDNMIDEEKTKGIQFRNISQYEIY